MIIHRKHIGLEFLFLYNKKNSYYSLPFCQPDYIYEETQTLGENLSGDRKMNSLYEIEYKGMHNNEF